ncbi:hypothetical protein EB796_005204 [Bugula neritina]|uniref:Vesicle-fusing ATPase n=1 Tax=Bugula neritina TaxID=10212 RepID=A0A7J7KF39_BUGNE|nr:hypothetical protein EB796_005204 [Bugula neritina]
MVALQDIKPTFGSSGESLEHLMANGIQEWGEPVCKVLEYGQVLLRQARNCDTSPLVSVLIEGPSQSGKTALAAKIALDSQFPFIRVCPVIGFTEKGKCHTIKQGRKLMVIATTSQRKVLGQLQMLDAFSTVITASNLTSPDHMITALQQMDSFNSAHLAEIMKEIKCEERVNIGIKKLIALVGLAKQYEDSQVVKEFMALLRKGSHIRMFLLTFCLSARLLMYIVIYL